jgi:hypothetical protein
VSQEPILKTYPSRGIFETTGEGVNPQQVKVQLLAAIRRLEREK